MWDNNKKTFKIMPKIYMGEYDWSDIFPTRLKTIYNSLSEDVLVNVGAQVKKGDVLGEVSVTNRKENNEGAHLHFYMMENGVVKDPSLYLTLDNK